ncbi:hypothetical protein [Streptomyces fulvoviolaceus]|uniref:hypothetical protein n=1 Tax=Streptomyces fulvoviolaceus TaxID=285535 RepID=UPI003B835097
MIIAIGESLIAMGLGATDHPLSTPLPAAAVLGCRRRRRTVVAPLRRSEPAGGAPP